MSRAEVLRRPVYAHDLASVPTTWEELVTGEGWDRDLTTIRREGVYYQVSNELLDDMIPETDFLAMLTRTPTWAQRAEWLRRESTVQRRTERAWARLRYAVSRRIWPHGDDEPDLR